MAFLFLLLKSCVFLPVSSPPSVAYMNLETGVVTGGRDGVAAAKGFTSNESSHYD